MSRKFMSFYKIAVGWQFLLTSVNKIWGKFQHKKVLIKKNFPTKMSLRDKSLFPAFQYRLQADKNELP